MSLEKYSDSELWEIINGITNVLQAHTPQANDNVFLFWYDTYKNIEREIDKRLLASE